MATPDAGVIVARKALGPAALAVGQAVAAALPAEPFVIGCSGGADSVALALGAQWATRGGGSFEVLVIDHGLQPASALVARQVVARLGQWGVAASVRRVDVVDSGAGLEAAARSARLGALAAPGRPVLLGHTADDQAETVLLGLARGSGTRSLAGMAPRRGPFVRPLLGLRREVTEQACREWGIEVWDDPHNRDNRFARVRVRRRVLPILEAELGPGIVDALCRTAKLCRVDADALDLAAPEPLEMRTSWLVGLETALRTRVIRRWLRECGAADVTAENVAAVDSLITQWAGQKGIDLVGGRVVRLGGRLQFQPR